MLKQYDLGAEYEIYWRNRLQSHACKNTASSERERCCWQLGGGGRYMGLTLVR